jgi:hypothetical protein
VLPKRIRGIIDRVTGDLDASILSEKLDILAEMQANAVDVLG